MGVLQGILMLLRFRADGFAWFGGTPQAFINSLAPLLALSLVAALRPLLAGSVRMFLLGVLQVVVALLVPMVVSHALARRWGRETHWLTYATAFNWCQTAVTLLAVLLIGVTAAGGAARGAVTMIAFGVGLYMLALGWFLLRTGLAVGGGKAALGLLLMQISTVTAVIGPLLLAAAAGGMDPEMMSGMDPAPR